jgi:4-aminobutyrate aminotransferase/(S)-3-amino-2-methylpropionate transaminase
MSMQVSALVPVAAEPVETKYRRIRTAIPVPGSIELLQRLRQVEPKSMQGMPPVLWGQAQGFLVRDPYGNQWIDLTSGIIVANAGHAHPRIVKAIRDQLDAQLLFTYAFPAVQRRQVLERLAALAPGGPNKAILFSSGTEATECCISLMRKHGLTFSPKKLGILSIEGCYHGRTLSAKFAGGNPGPVDGLDRAAVFHYQLPLPGGPDSQGFEKDLAQRNIDPSTTAGIILESIPGWSTTLFPQQYMDDLMRWTDKHHVLLATDEVQCGMGRTGRMFAFEHYAIIPDLIACGKGLSSSVPASAVIGRGEIMDLAAPGEMSSTFGGNPVSVAAIMANLDVIRDEKLVERSARVGECLGKALRQIADRHRPHIDRLEGHGLFYSLHLRDPRTGKLMVESCDQIVLEAVRRGVLMFVTGRGMIKFAPPLMIEESALLEAVEVVGEMIDRALD